jgi:1-acyl-sn-glycerol-3-phosphate acyltransferase
MIKNIRLIIFSLYMVLWGIVGNILCLIRPFTPLTLPIICWLLGRFSFLLYGVKYRGNRQEAFNDRTPVIFMSNHQSNFDALTFARVNVKNCVTVGKKSLRKIPFFGTIYWLSGNILLNRSKKKSAKQTMVQTADIIKEKKISVWVMPEGTRNHGKGLLDFKKGPFYTAVHAGVPIVPVAISSYCKFFDLNKIFGNKIVVEALEPIPTAGLAEKDIPELLAKVKASIEAGIIKIDSEIEKENKA